MTEQELRENFIKKLTKLLYDLDINIYIQGTNKIFATFGLAKEDIEHIADRLIAAEIGYVSEWKHRAEKAERALSSLVHEMYEHDIRPMCDEKFFIESRLIEAEKELEEKKK